MLKLSKKSKLILLLEQIFDSITHGIGFGLAIAGLVVLIVYGVKYGNIWHIVSYSIYGTSLIILFLASTLLHSMSHLPKILKVFEKIDHSAIFILIAGTYTPYCLTLMRGGLGWTIFGIIWALAIIGIVIKCVLGIEKTNAIGVLMYILMGWMIVFGLKYLLLLPKTGLILLVLGGIFYTISTPFYLLDKHKPFFHTIWHLFVLLAAILHFFSMFYLIKF